MSSFRWNNNPMGGIGRKYGRPARREAPEADRFRPTQAGWHASLVATLAYAGVLLLLVAYLPGDVFDSTSHIFILSIGVIGLWRYGW